MFELLSVNLEDTWELIPKCKKNLWMAFCVNAVLSVFLPITGQAAESYIDKSFRLISQKVGVKEELLRAICWQESRHLPHAYVENDGGKGNAAFGICQVLYTTAQQFGFKDDRCKNSFTDKTPKDRKYKTCKLFGPKTNMYFAAMFLKSRLRLYNGNQYKAVAAYNAGRFRLCADGWLYIKGKKFKRCKIGGAVNSYYIRKVYRALREGR